MKIACLAGMAIASAAFATEPAQTRKVEPGEFLALPKTIRYTLVARALHEAKPVGAFNGEVERRDDRFRVAMRYSDGKSTEMWIDGPLFMMDHPTKSGQLVITDYSSSGAPKSEWPLPFTEFLWVFANPVHVDPKGELDGKKGLLISSGDQPEPGREPRAVLIDPKTKLPILHNNGVALVEYKFLGEPSAISIPSRFADELWRRQSAAEQRQKAAVFMP